MALDAAEALFAPPARALGPASGRPRDDPAPCRQPRPVVRRGWRRLAPCASAWRAHDRRAPMAASRGAAACPALVGGRAGEPQCRAVLLPSGRRAMEAPHSARPDVRRHFPLPPVRRRRARAAVGAAGLQGLSARGRRRARRGGTAQLCLWRGLDRRAVHAPRRLGAAVGAEGGGGCAGGEDGPRRWGGWRRRRPTRLAVRPQSTVAAERGRGLWLICRGRGCAVCEAVALLHGMICVTAALPFSLSHSLTPRQ